MSYSYNILDTKGKKVGDQKMSKDVFSDDVINEGLVHEYVVMYLANQRQSTAHTKTRSEVRRSGRKLYRQKGTGSARVGDAGSPIRRKWWVVWWPRNTKIWTKSMNSKMKQKALRSAVSLKAKSETLYGLKDLALDAIKTKEVAASFKNMKLHEKKLLVVLPEVDDIATKSMRNISTVRYTTSAQLNPYDLMSNKNVLFVGDAYDRLEERLK